MKINELVKTMRNEKPDLFKGIKNADAAALIREALTQVRESVARNEEGVVRINGLGVFRTVTSEREVGGQKVKGKRIVFRAATPKE